MNILPYLKEVNNIPSVMLMTPFYSKIIDESRFKSASASAYDGETAPVSTRTEITINNINQHVEKDTIESGLTYN